MIQYWPAERAIYRGHESGIDGRRFNPGFGKPTRFAFFTYRKPRRFPFLKPKAANVAVLYGGNVVEVAIAETLFHDLPLTLGATLLHPTYCNYAYSRMTPTRKLKLAALHGNGLRRLGLRNDQICDTDAIEYPDTVKWAEALHSRLDLALDGLVWMSRQFNHEEAIVLFGDRVTQQDLELDDEERDIPFATGKGLGMLLIAAERARIRVQTPPAAYLS
jgi:RES domain